MAIAAALPRHLRRPGDDGYRTPTIEDAERSVSAASNGGAFPFPVPSSREAHTSALGALNESIFRSSMSETEKGRKETPDSTFGVERAGLTKGPSEWPEKLTWKQRIRHFTWAYFTLTMATGGIANVLYAGKGMLLGMSSKLC